MSQPDWGAALDWVLEGAGSRDLGAAGSEECLSASQRCWAGPWGRLGPGGPQVLRVGGLGSLLAASDMT